MATKPNQTSFTSERAKALRATATNNKRTALPGNHPTVREARAAHILQARLAGMNATQSAALVNLSPERANDELHWYRNTGKLREYEQQVADLAPNAIAVAKAGLEKGDTKVALKILELLLRLGERAEARSSKEGDRAASLDDYITKLQVKAAYAAAQVGVASAPDDPAPIDAEVLVGAEGPQCP